MRSKDEFKQEALLRATVKSVNEFGFAASSITKIAKEADISSATIYVYFKNKEDLLVSTYLSLKRTIGTALLEGFDDTHSVREIFYKIWVNIFEFSKDHGDLLDFVEQFSNSPFGDLIEEKQLEDIHEPFLRVFNRGIDEGVLKNITFEMLAAFIFYPALTLANTRRSGEFKANKKNIENAFIMAWDAITL